MKKRWMRILCSAVTMCSCGIMLMSCDIGEETSSDGVKPVYKSNVSSNTTTGETSEKTSSQTVSEDDESSNVSSKTPSKPDAESSETSYVPSGDIGGDTTENKSGDIIFIEGVGYDILSVVNKNYRLEEDCAAPKLVTLPDSTTDRGDVKYQADARAAEPLAAFLKDARAAGYKPIMYSAYRSYEKQKKLYETRVSEWLKAHPGKTREEAEANITKTAPTGTSEHCTGLAFDIYSWEAYNKYGKLSEHFEDYKLCQWLLANAHKYGFILRFPKDKESITMIDYEPWHFRYVGVEAATEIYNKGLCLEEYTGKTK